MSFTMELEQETDRRWIAEVPELLGALVYGSKPEEATAKVKSLALGSWRTGWIRGRPTSKCTP